MSKITIITVNYSQMAVTIDLLKSIGEFDPKKIEIIVVDNGSKINETARLKTLFPQVNVLRSESNLGFAGGNNLGINASTGDYLFLLNNDTIVDQQTVFRLKAVLETNAEIAIACPLIYFFDAPDTIQYAGFTSISPVTGRNHALYHKQKLPTSNAVVETEYAHGAAMMIKRKVIKEIGQMPENYFLYYEELDWVHSIRKHGYKVVVDYNCHILHRESISTGKASPLKTYFQTRNRILFMRRNFKGLNKLLFYLFFTLISFPKYLLISILKREYNHLRSFWEGVKWNLTNKVDSKRLGYIYDALLI